MRAPAGLERRQAKISFVPNDPATYRARQQPCEIGVFRDSKADRAYIELGMINYHDERHRTPAGGLNVEAALRAATLA